jgi:HemY protein
MRALLWLLTLAGLAVGLSLAARYNHGYALFVLPPWRIEVSINLLLLALIGGFLLGYLLLRALVHTVRLPRAVAEFRARKARDKAESGLRDAMRFLIEGRYGHALRQAESAYAAGHARGLAAVIAVRAAHGMRDDQREAEWLERARAEDGAIKAARLMTEAELALESRRYADASTALEKLQSSEGRHIAALRLALRAEQGLGNWNGVLRLAHQLEKHKALTGEQAASLRLRAHRENLKALRDDAVQLSRYWREMSEPDRLEPRLAVEAARALAAAGDCAEAARVVEDCLDERWDSSLIVAYAECEGGDVLARIAHAEKWLASHPGDAQLLYVLGKLCRQNQLWGKAQSYLEASLAIQPSRDGHLELAALLDSLDKAEAAEKHYRAAAAS